MKELITRIRNRSKERAKSYRSCAPECSALFKEAASALAKAERRIKELEANQRTGRIIHGDAE